MPPLATPYAKLTLSNVVQEVLRKCQKLYIAKGTEDDRDFDLSIEPDLQSICDEYYIRKSFENLIINSIQYCKKGKISISLAKEEDKIKFTVSYQFTIKGTSIMV